jgi:hypothetical protein
MWNAGVAASAVQNRTRLLIRSGLEKMEVATKIYSPHWSFWASTSKTVSPWMDEKVASRIVPVRFIVYDPKIWKNANCLAH